MLPVYVRGADRVLGREGYPAGWAVPIGITVGQPLWVSSTKGTEDDAVRDAMKAVEDWMNAQRKNPERAREE